MPAFYALLLVTSLYFILRLMYSGVFVFNEHAKFTYDLYYIEMILRYIVHTEYFCFANMSLYFIYIVTLDLMYEHGETALKVLITMLEM